jgi:hypothetical protein
MKINNLDIFEHEVIILKIVFLYIFVKENSEYLESTY